MGYQNYTLAALQALVYTRLQSNIVFFSNVEITDTLNEAIRIFQLGTGYWRGRVQIATVAKRCVYSIPSGALVVTRLSFNGVPLDPASVWDIDNCYPGWQTQTTITASAPSQPSLWGPFGGINYFFLWPADAVGNNGLQADCILKAPVLVNQNDYINIDSSEIRGILDYCQHILSFKRGGQVFLATMPMLENFQRAMLQRNSMLKASDPFKRLLGSADIRTKRPRSVSDAGGKGALAAR